MEVEMSLQKKNLAQKFQLKKKLEPSEVEKLKILGNFEEFSMGFQWVSLPIQGDMVHVGEPFTRR